MKTLSAYSLILLAMILIASCTPAVPEEEGEGPATQEARPVQAVDCSALDGQFQLYNNVGAGVFFCYPTDWEVISSSEGIIGAGPPEESESPGSGVIILNHEFASVALVASAEEMLERTFEIFGFMYWNVGDAERQGSVTFSELNGQEVATQIASLGSDGPQAVLKGFRNGRALAGAVGTIGGEASDRDKVETMLDSIIIDLPRFVPQDDKTSLAFGESRTGTWCGEQTSQYSFQVQQGQLVLALFELTDTDSVPTKVLLFDQQDQFLYRIQVEDSLVPSGEVVSPAQDGEYKITVSNLWSDVLEIPGACAEYRIDLLEMSPGAEPVVDFREGKLLAGEVQEFPIQGKKGQPQILFARAVFPEDTMLGLEILDDAGEKIPYSSYDYLSTVLWTGLLFWTPESDGHYTVELSGAENDTSYELIILARNRD